MPPPQLRAFHSEYEADPKFKEMSFKRQLKIKQAASLLAPPESKEKVRMRRLSKKLGLSDVHDLEKHTGAVADIPIYINGKMVLSDYPEEEEKELDIRDEDIFLADNED